MSMLAEQSSIDHLESDHNVQGLVKAILYSTVSVLEIFGTVLEINFASSVND